MRILISRCYGGFGVTQEVIKRLRKLGNEDAQWPNEVLDGEMYKDGSGPRTTGIGEPSCDLDTVERTDPQLIQIVEEIGLKKSSSWAAELAIIEIPDDVKWVIEEYDGIEWVAEKHRTWNGNE